MKKPHLKILITILILLMLGTLSVPFSKYFGIATHSQLTKTEVVKNNLPRVIPDSETIKAPDLQDVINAYGKQNNAAIGQIVAPSVSVSQPIFVGLTKDNMAQGTVSLFPKRDPSQQTLTVIGHHVQYDSSLLFGGVQELKKDAEIYIRYFDKYYVYKVESNRIIKETDLEALQDKGANYLYLITCNTATQTPYRVLVTAKKVTVPSQHLQASFTHEQKVIKEAHTKSYWIKFLLPLFITLVMTVLFLIYIWKL
ncbi:class A sortase [Lactococcus garvieae]|uniref:class A sortase n=1 Tax=Lactococcus garvieae TaxID=1363 RepID=UPI0018D8BFBA|nr:class A sortase [Lactococcus garvieae]QPS72046.1 class A sortase [Lactococcus garvieae]